MGPLVYTLKKTHRNPYYAACTPMHDQFALNVHSDPVGAAPEFSALEEKF